MSTNLESLRASLTDRYTIERELGQGAMASVYLAQDLKHPASRGNQGPASQARSRHRRHPQFVIFSLGWPNTNALRVYPEHRAMLKEIGLPGVVEHGEDRSKSSRAGSS
jgi:serine/threonine protein kinase